MMNKINELKPGDEGVVIEALINRVVVGKTNGANRLPILVLLYKMLLGQSMLNCGMQLMSK